jgi:TRAP-type C4-dicarboxylate transport system permease large subunit
MARKLIDRRALYVLLGTFLDEVSPILITVPVTLPLVRSALELRS